MIKCPICGKENRDDAYFCDQCGYELRKNVENPVALVIKIILGILGIVLIPVALLIASMTLIGLFLYLFLLMMTTGVHPLIWTLIFMIPVIISIPYWIKVFQLRTGQPHPYRFIFKYALKWFLKGPFAYKDLK